MSGFENIPFGVIAGVWAIAMLIVYISVLRLVYAVEHRSGLRQADDRTSFANIPAVVMNRGIADDTETQALRWRVIQRVGVILCGFIVFALYVSRLET